MIEEIITVNFVCFDMSIFIAYSSCSPGKNDIVKKSLASSLCASFCIDYVRSREYVMTEVSCRVTIPIALSFIIPLGTTVVFPLWRQVMVDTNYLCVKYTLNVRVCRFTGATSTHYCIRDARFASFE